MTKTTPNQLNHHAGHQPSWTSWPPSALAHHEFRARSSSVLSLTREAEASYVVEATTQHGVVPQSGYVVQKSLYQRICHVGIARRAIHDPPSPRPLRNQRALSALPFTVRRWVAMGPCEHYVLTPGGLWCPDMRACSHHTSGTATMVEGAAASRQSAY